MEPVFDRSNSDAALRFARNTGYSLIQENGQRKYGGPPPNWILNYDLPPPEGSELFIGKIPRDCFENELIPIFETYGIIYEFRLMLDFSGSNRGYGFIKYTNAEDALRARTTLDGYEIRVGHFIGVKKCVNNRRLFVGKIPKTKSNEDIFTAMSMLTEGVVKVITCNGVSDQIKNRGFAFVEYVSHKAAANARVKLIPGDTLLWGQYIVVDWAEPQREIDSHILTKVKILYVKSLKLQTTETQIRNLFNELTVNSVEKVKKLRDFAFVHFRTHEIAQIALHATNGQVCFDGKKAEVTWAKPAPKKNKFP